MYLFLLVPSSWSSHGPVSAAMGGSGRSAVIPGETTLNPAMIPHIQGYHATVSYREHAFDPTGQESRFKASLIDSNPDNLFPAAFAFEQIADDQVYSIGISKFFFSHMTLGFEIQRYISDPKGGHKEIENDFSIGAMYTILPNWGAGLVFDNIVRTNIASLDQAITLATSYFYNEIVLFQADLMLPTQNNDDNKPVFMGGIESHFIKEFPVRLGYRRNSLENTTFWTAGMGWVGPKIALDYAFEKSTQSNKEVAHSVDLRIYF